jgi:hypothetical protein
VTHASEDSLASGLAVLYGVRGYVQQFFTCRECVKNFLIVAYNMEAEAMALGRHGASLWLWQAHNNVSTRIGGCVCRGKGRVGLN